MKIAYSLRPADTGAAATALLLPSSRAADLFELLERLRLEPLPAVFATADGFLVRLRVPHPEPIAGVIRLRAIARNFYLPVDAELVPPLLADEAEGLTSRRGLVVLAGARFLEFSPDRAIEWGTLVRTEAIGKLGSLPPHQEWSALPETPELAEGLVELSSSFVPPPVEAILEQGRQDIGSESPQPPGAANIGSQILGTSLFVTGHLAAWLGTKLGLDGIANAGANLLGKALDRVPRLSEFLMNQQEAILRRLLKDFREGRIEDALRRALPLGGPPSQPVVPSGSTTLPWNNLLHSLDNLIGRRSGGVGAGWFTPQDVYWSLQAEYRKQAEEAARRGDFRRAAFIYAKLLYDLSAAARVLSAGGLHRDAAIVYEKGLNNPRAAANEWEAAGEIDRAVEILVGLHDHLAAAEVLQRAGEESRALVLFHAAIEKLVVAAKHFEAGELMRTKARRPELALALFRDGWKTRPRQGAIPCGQALATHYAEEPNPTRFRDLVRDAEKCAPEWPAEAVARFFNALVRHSNRPELGTVQEEVHDRSLLTLAAKMERSHEPSLFFGADTPWPNPVVRDAQFAVGRRPAVVSSYPVELLRPGPAVVRAVCRMPRSGDLFLGFDNGEVVRQEMRTGKSRTILKHEGTVTGLECDFEEETLMIVTRSWGRIHTALTATRATGFEPRVFRQNLAGEPIQLLRLVRNRSTKQFGLVSGDQIELIRTDSPILLKSIGPLPQMPITGGILGDTDEDGPWILLFFGRTMQMRHRDAIIDEECQSWIGMERKSTLHQPPLFGTAVSLGVSYALWDSPSGMQSVKIDDRDPLGELIPREVPRHLLANAADFLLPEMLDAGPGGMDKTGLQLRLKKERDAGRLTNPVAAYVEKGGDFLVVEANGSVHHLPRT